MGPIYDAISFILHISPAPAPGPLAGPHPRAPQAPQQEMQTVQGKEKQSNPGSAAARRHPRPCKAADAVHAALRRFEKPRNLSRRTAIEAQIRALQDDAK